MASESDRISSNSGISRSELLSDARYNKSTVMAEAEQPGYTRPRYTVTVTGESPIHDGTSPAEEAHG